VGIKSNPGAEKVTAGAGAAGLRKMSHHELNSSWGKIGYLSHWTLLRDGNEGRFQLKIQMCTSMRKLRPGTNKDDLKGEEDAVSRVHRSAARR